MTEAEWLACDDPKPMLEFLRGKVSDRKLRLFACACARRVQHLLTDAECIQAIEVGEIFADGRCHSAELAKARRHCVRSNVINSTPLPFAPEHFASAAAGDAADDDISETVDDVRNMAQRAVDPSLEDWRGEVHGGTEAYPQSVLLRDIIGNPFRSVDFLAQWRAPNIVEIARQMYESKDFGATMILADALEDAVCTNRDILDHCRQPGVHVRGCWVVDLVLGKS